MTVVNPLSSSYPAVSDSQATSPEPANPTDLQNFNLRLAAGDGSGGTASAPIMDSPDWSAFWAALPNSIVLEGMNYETASIEELREINGL
jgi:hypothetical protein